MTLNNVFNDIENHCNELEEEVLQFINGPNCITAIGAGIHVLFEKETGDIFFYTPQHPTRKPVGNPRLPREFFKGIVHTDGQLVFTWTRPDVQDTRRVVMGDATPYALQWQEILTEMYRNIDAKQGSD